MKKNIFLICCLSIFFGCLFHFLGYLTNHIGTTEFVVPPRPTNLSTDAFWQGGIDGGNWYSCRSAETDFELHCKIYDDDGNIVMEDNFELYISLNNTGKEVPMKDFQKQTYLTADNVSAFNGISDIYIQGSLVLKSKNHTWDNPIPYGVSEQ